MIRTIKTFIALCRPALVLLFLLVTAIGLAEGGRPGDPTAALDALLPVVAFLVFAVAVNDLSDEDIDRVNVPDDRRRPLVSGLARRRDMGVVAGSAAALSLVAAARLGVAGIAVTAAGLTFAWAYSLEPIRLAKRGVVASLTLPLGYVAVPFTIGLLAAGAPRRPADAVVFGSLYVAFVGRLVLKDFRDVRGDVLFGKRTFLVRHGRRPALLTAFGCWTVGAVGLLLATGPTAASAATLLAVTCATAVVLIALDRSVSARRDEALVSAAAILGRGTLTVVLAHGSLRSTGWSTLGAAAVLVAITVLALGAAERMARIGPRTRLVVPDHLVPAQDSRDRASRLALASSTRSGRAL